MSEAVVSPYSNELHHTRLVFILETAPLSNEFRQILLTKEQWMNVEQVIRDQMRHVSPNHFDVPCRDDVRIKADGIEDFYTTEQIVKLLLK